MSVPVVDRATFDALKATTGAEFACELVDTFLQEAPIMLNDLRSALASHDVDKFRRSAHSLKSNSDTFGAFGLGAMARELEHLGASKVMEQGGQPLAALGDELARVAAALKALCDA